MIVRDEITAVDTVTTIRWTLLTPAQVTITGKNTAELSQQGKKMYLAVDANADVTMKTWPTDPPPHDYDAPNPGTIRTGFEITIPANSSISFTVSLSPSAAVTTKKTGALQSWPHD